MDEPPKPGKRLVLCRGQYCNIDRRADKLYKLIQPLVDEINGDHYPPRVRIETANCLSMCGAGPNCLIHPGALPFNHLDAEKLTAIVEAYLREEASAPGSLIINGEGEKDTGV